MRLSIAPALPVGLLRALGAAGLGAAGGLHAAWAVGSTFPQPDRTALALAVTGSPELPPPAACAVMAVGLVGAGAVVAGVGGERRTAVLVRVSTGAALLGRGLLGGVMATRVLRMPVPQQPFRRLDARYYRPLCTVLGVAALASSRRRPA